MKRMMHPMHGFHIVYDGNTEATMRLNGWVDEVVSSPETVTSSAGTREDLELAAEEKGVRIDKRWSNARLAEEIEKA